MTSRSPRNINGELLVLQSHASSQDWPSSFSSYITSYFLSSVPFSTEMQSHNSDLASVERRLRSIVTHFLDSNDASIKSADLEIDPSLPRYVCAECAFSTTKSNELASHFRAQHILRPSFPCRWGRCTIRCVSQEAIDRHRRANHGIPCPQGDCGKVFMSTIELHHHLGESHTLKNPSTIFECPYPSCGQGFPHHNALLGHYDDRHPPYIYQDGKKAPYKCPFCAKRYIKERYMTPHVRSHLANRWAPNDQGGTSSRSYSFLLSPIRGDLTHVARLTRGLLPISCS